MSPGRIITQNQWQGSHIENLTVVGICSYQPQVQRWLRTLRIHYDGPCLLCLVNGSAEVRKHLADKFGCEVVDARANSEFWTEPPPVRFARVWLCLADACLGRVRTPNVLRTDVWDVVFQGDPRAYLDPRPDRILVALESQTLGADALNQRWLGDWFSRIPDGKIVNGGLICGETARVAAVARVIASKPFGTDFDQSELTLLVNTLPDAFEYRPGFMENIYNTLTASGAVRHGAFVDWHSSKPWCVVHGNGSTKTILDRVYPLIPTDCDFDEAGPFTDRIICTNIARPM